ncbi:hypothetical protein [Nitrosomonas sp. Nm166]|uniref:hypothetical protein n=1 Tax=Nitrosomonas sp. Nm166 TaxID=1881054 RepID=UPI0008DFEA7A|nr:hypothetical protein [Nitrosomonas sp. Nm166]SFE30870.1 hypothetical protein SAMN05428977_101218 [Nitrosomonas sp. Nm166]
MSTSAKEERRQLFERYQQCTSMEQTAINLLAVVWGGLNKSQITTPLRKILGADEAIASSYGIDRLAQRHCAKF